MTVDEPTPFNALMTIIVIAIVCLLGAAMVLIMAPMTGTFVQLDEIFYANASVPTSLQYSVASVINMEYATSTNVINNTVISDGIGCHSLLVTNNAGVPGYVTITHEPDPTGLNFVTFNGANIGLMTNNITDTFVVPAYLITNGVNQVCFGGA